MSWPITLVAVIIFYVLYQFGKKFEKLEEDKPVGYSYSFSIDAQEAIIYHPKFLKDAKIKASDKKYGEWSKEDKEKFSTFVAKHLGNKGFIRITYLARENGFFIQGQNKSDFQLRDTGTKNIYGVRIIGNDNDVLKDNLDFELFVNAENGPDGKYRDYIVGSLKERFQGLGNSPKTDILFKFPYNSIDLKDEDYKALGFKVKREGGDDVYKNSLGEMQSTPTTLSLEKNKTEIQIEY